MENMWMAILGFAGGSMVAGGVIALIVGLGILTRFIGISHTATQVRYYETMVVLGALAGNYATVFADHLMGGRLALLFLGISAGIYLGGWIMALAEMLNIFPILARRSKLKLGSGLIVWAIAVGKVIGSLIYFYMGW
ncbi:MAG: stage V sporulation protein AB [Muricoprocola sp.]